jgi:hypothetical protein
LGKSGLNQEGFGQIYTRNQEGFGQGAAENQESFGHRNQEGFGQISEVRKVLGKSIPESRKVLGMIKTNLVSLYH